MTSKSHRGNNQENLIVKSSVERQLNSSRDSMKTEHISMHDVREPSKELAQKEMEEFAGNVSNNQLCPPVDPVVPTGEWKHCQISNRVTAYINVLGVSIYRCGSVCRPCLPWLICKAVLRRHFQTIF